MEIAWIEDFLSLADTRSFSRAAKLRNSSQPAFSRRIQALESWLGAELIDRSSNPPTLTAAGRAFRGFAGGIVRQLYQARDILRGQQKLPERNIQFAVSYTLSLTFFPDWFAELHKSFPEATAHVAEMNVMDGATALAAGNADFLVCYHHPQIPILLDVDRYPYISLSKESIQPYSAVDGKGNPIYRLPGNAEQPLPFLPYTSETFFVHVVDMILLNSPQPHFLENCYQSQMSEALKAMVVAGNGVAWLPEKCVTRELRDGQIAVAGAGNWSTQLEIRIFRSSENRMPLVDQLWNFLLNYAH
jgi:LysR family transcriptional regulator, hypochlorite-specific transcription factor HypT